MDMDIKGKTIAITGSTGGIGIPLCKELLKRGANLILVDRNKSKSLNLRELLLKEFINAEITHVTADMADINSVKKATDELINLEPDFFIHNAGAYSIPRFITENGYDNVFHINFVAPYYMIKKLAPMIKEKGGRIIATGSIAHRYSKSDINDFDFRTDKKASLVYGNAKRFLMFSLYELFKNDSEMLSIVHPGITFTGITNHYPKLIFFLIKYPMKLIFMKPKKACLTTVEGLYKCTPYSYWIGPKIFDIWGKPKLSKIKTDNNEVNEIFSKAEEIYNAENKKS